MANTQEILQGMWALDSLHLGVHGLWVTCRMLYDGAYDEDKEEGNHQTKEQLGWGGMDGEHEEELGITTKLEGL